MMIVEKGSVMQTTNIESNAARYLRLIERCLPKIFRGPSRRRIRRATEMCRKSLFEPHEEEKGMERTVILIIALLSFGLQSRTLCLKP